MHGIEEFGPGRIYDINKEEEIEIEIVGELVEIDMTTSTRNYFGGFLKLVTKI